MIKKISTLMFMSFSALLLTATCLSADETSERTPVGIRAESAQVRAMQLQARAKMAALNPEDSNQQTIKQAAKSAPKNARSKAFLQPDDFNETVIKEATEAVLNDARAKTFLQPEDFNETVIREATEAVLNNARAKAFLQPEDFNETVIREATETVLNNAKANAVPKNMKSMKMMAPAIAKSMYYTTHPAVYQNPISISFFGDTIELMDGSIWTISSLDAYKAASWYSTDLLVITPNHSWFSSYGFRLTNQSTGESVAANLNLGPMAPSYGRYTHWIVAVDYYYNVVYLEDNSVWNMSSFDSNIVNQWVAGDVVMIGVNDGWLSGSKPNVLINVAMLNFAAGAVSF